MQCPYDNHAQKMLCIVVINTLFLMPEDWRPCWAFVTKKLQNFQCQKYNHLYFWDHLYIWDFLKSSSEFLLNYENGHGVEGRWLSFLIPHGQGHHMQLISLGTAHKCLWMVTQWLKSSPDLTEFDFGYQPYGRQWFHVLYLQERISFLQCTSGCGLDRETSLISVSSGLATSYELSGLF
jgi:hypothetical protein